MELTVTALDGATSEELIAALMARHRAALWQTCGPLERPAQVEAVARALTRTQMEQLGAAINAAVGAFMQEHPATAPPEMPEGGMLMLGGMPGGVQVLQIEGALPQGHPMNGLLAQMFGGQGRGGEAGPFGFIERAAPTDEDGGRKKAKGKKAKKAKRRADATPPTD